MVAAGRIIDRDFDDFSARRAREQSRPFPAGIRRDECRPLPRARVADVIQRDAAIGHDGGHPRKPEVLDLYRRAQLLEAQRRRIGTEFIGGDRAQHRLPNRSRQRDMVGVCSHPPQLSICEQRIEITVASSRFSIHRLPWISGYRMGRTAPAPECANSMLTTISGDCAR